MTTVAEPRRRYLPDFDLPSSDWVERQPAWLIGGGVVVLAMALSAFVRTRYLNGQFWMDEALSVGISSHSLSAIPGVLRHDGSPPLYYMLLHVWMSVVGYSESQTHAMSLLFGLLTMPVGTWIAWSLFGRRAGLIAAVLFAMNPFLTAYSQETRMYTLMALLGLLATAGLIHGFIYRRRSYLILFAICQALMLYTHAWGIFFGVGAALALIPCGRYPTTGAAWCATRSCRSARRRSCSCRGCRRCSTRPPTPARRGTPRRTSARRSRSPAT